jgi:polyketide biosynthesis 3-hydroxy-3-methylglutaryl-CoA synthase-like enzyme PksG
MGVGIEAMNAYVGRAYVDVAELFERRGLDTARFANLMMEQKSVNLPFEDPVTNAVNAARPIIDRLAPAERASIELVAVGTESSFDFGKSMSTYVHHYLGLSPRCRSFEVKHACYAGTAALQAAAGIVGAGPARGARALVVATDASSIAARGTYWEPSEGAGAVAMLVSDRPDVLELDPGASGYHSYEVMDTLRPSVETDVVNADLSVLAYMECLDRSFQSYCERVASVDVVDSFHYLALHTPFAGMVRGAHRSLLRKRRRATAAAVEEDFQARVAQSLAYCVRVGNLFSGSLYLALCSLIDRGDFSTPRRVGLFSYGSGCASEFYSGVVTRRACERLAEHGIGAALDDRYRLTLDEYDLVNDLSVGRGFGVRENVFETTPYAALAERQFEGRGLLVLDRIDDYHRQYRWS